MREIRLRDFSLYCVLRDLVLNVWVIVLCALTFGNAADLFFTNVYQNEYTSSVTLYVSMRDSTGTSYVNLSNACDMAEILSEVFESDIMREKTAQAMGYDQLPATISAEVPKNVNLLTVSATADTPMLAYQVAVAVMENHGQVSDYVFSNAVLDVLSQPELPAGPSNYVSFDQMIAYARYIGAAVAVLVILAFALLRDTVMTKAAVEDKLDAELFGVLPRERKNRTLKTFLLRTNRVLLITNPAMGFQYVESVRRIATRILHNARLKGNKVYLITSARENEGKSTVSANMALALAQSGKKVVLIDCDMRKPALYKIFDIKPKSFGELSDVLKGVKTAEDIAVNHSSGITLLLSQKNHHNAIERLGMDAMRQVIEWCRANYDIVPTRRSSSCSRMFPMPS